MAVGISAPGVGRQYVLGLIARGGLAAGLGLPRIFGATPLYGIGYSSGSNLAGGPSTGDASIHVFANNRVSYSSGGATCVEGLFEGRWASLYWSLAHHPKPERNQWGEDAFRIAVKTEPSLREQPGRMVSSGWQWVSASQVHAPAPEMRHNAVRLSNSVVPLDVEVHTVLDGTPVFIRWLKLTNTSDKAMGLTELSPWSGRLWSGHAPIVAGHSTRWEYGWEGWFGWEPLRDGSNVIREDRGLVWDDPYFIVRNEAKGEYFFGELAWPVNYRMEFQKGENCSFAIGPTGDGCLLVMAPGESITTPAVHLARLRLRAASMSRGIAAEPARKLDSFASGFTTQGVWATSKGTLMMLFRHCTATSGALFSPPGSRNGHT
jgi:hypothetical protein